MNSCFLRRGEANPVTVGLVLHGKPRNCFRASSRRVPLSLKSNEDRHQPRVTLPQIRHENVCRDLRFALAEVQVARRPIILMGLLTASAAQAVKDDMLPALADEPKAPEDESAALAAEQAGDWKTAAEIWKTLTDAAEGPGRRDKQAGAKFRFRYALCLLEMGDKASAVKALEVSARVLRGADVRAALAATLWSSGEGEKAEAYWLAATEQGGASTLTEEYTRDVLLWPPSAVEALSRFRAAEAPPPPDSAAQEDIAKFEKARATKEYVREKLGAANSLEDVIFGGK